MKIKKQTRFECPICGQAHEEFQDALDCCEPVPEEVEGWVCGECGEFWTDKDDAKECCK